MEQKLLLHPTRLDPATFHSSEIMLTFSVIIAISLSLVVAAYEADRV
jgi:hypothetical protein